MSKPNWKNKTIWTGDNLDILQGLNSESVDLIYLDPPFNSNENYQAPIGSPAKGAGFKDTWNWMDVDIVLLDELQKKNDREWFFIQNARFNHSDSMGSYLLYMLPRLKEMKRVLKPTGSIYLHCDTAASHYLKGLMDVVFGKDNFQNEIVWEYTNAWQNPPDKFQKSHNYLLFYCASKKRTFNSPREKKYTKIQLQYMKRGYHRSKSRNFICIYDKANANVVKKLPQWKKEGFKIYYIDIKKKRLNDVWKVAPVGFSGKEKTGYKTQKPLALLRRIIEASSNPGDVVLDPFCGTATTCVAAEELGREWIGIDVSKAAGEIIEERVNKGAGAKLHNKWSCHKRMDQPHRTDLCEEIKDPKDELINPQDPKERTRMYNEQKGRCGLCNHDFKHIRHLETDHVIPKSRGGTNQRKNLQLLCGSCNRTKGNKTNEEAYVILKKRGWIKED